MPQISSSVRRGGSAQTPSFAQRLKAGLVTALLVSAGVVDSTMAPGIRCRAEIGSEPPLLPTSSRRVRRRELGQTSLNPPPIPELPAFVDSGRRLRDQRASLQPTIQWLRQKPRVAALYQEIETFLARPHSIVQLGGGVGGSYLLKDETATPRWVVKPVDEDTRGPNNVGNAYTGPDTLGMRQHPNIPLLTQPQRELASRLVADSLGLSHMLPEVVILPVDFTDHPHAVRGVDDPVKLCSVARFVPGTLHADDVWGGFVRLGEQPLGTQAKTFAEDSFAELMLLTWAIYDTDAHPRNTLVAPAGGCSMDMHEWLSATPEQQQSVPLRLIRIDAGQAMPESNEALRNDMAGVEMAQQPLSAGLRQRFLDSVTDTALQRTASLIDRLGLYPDGASRAGQAYVQRMQLLRSWIEQSPGLTLQEINERFITVEHTAPIAEYSQA